MEWILVIVIALIAGVLVLKRLSFVSPEAARKLLAEGALVVDVRSPGEFRGGQVSGAVNIPLDQLAEALPRRVPDNNKPLLLHCLSGARSGMAKRQLQGMGYANVHNLGSFSRARQIVNGS